MNICFLTKYPPIEGGVSMRCYWLARGLAARGHRVTVVTNADEVEAEYRIRMTADDLEWYEYTDPETGGSVVVENTERPTDATHHIPFSNPYVTKLASMATAAVRQHECDAIFAYYLQPYGLAAHLAGHWTDTPYAIRHAGSDVGRLMKDVQLRTAYQEVFRGAGRVVTGADPETFVAMGVDRDRIWASRGFPLPDIFTADAVPIDLNGLVWDLVADEARDDVSHLTNSAHIDPSIPTVGIYGKVGAVKGSFDLLHALARLKTEGVRFNFVAVTQGRALGRFTALVHELGLEDRTWILPFLPHWRIPGFIRACTCVCFLERDFPVAIHGPTVPREVLACGTCLVVSREIATRQHFRGEARDGEHFVTIDTPRHHANLAARLADVIHNPDRAAAMGAAGHALYRESLEPNEWDVLLADFERHLAAMSSRDHTPSSTTREERLGACLPLLKTALGERWDGLIRGYCSPEGEVSAQYHDAMQCTEFMARKLNGGTGPAWLQDVLTYERVHNHLYAAADQDSEEALASEHPKTTHATLAVFEPAQRDHLATLRPTLSQDVDIRVFEHDMTQVCTALHKNDLTETIAKGPTVILFKSSPTLFGEELVINENTRRLLMACDGRHTVRELIDTFTVPSCADDSVELDPDAVATGVIAMLRQFVRKEIVTL